jgi:hypothetical protein
MRSIKGLPPPDCTGCSAEVDSVPWLLLMEVPPCAVRLQLPLAQPAMVSCLQNTKRSRVLLASNWDFHLTSQCSPAGCCRAMFTVTSQAY